MSEAFLYPAKVRHQRLMPKLKAFSYRVFMISADLEKLPELAKKTPFFSHNRFNFFSIDDRDHFALGHPGGIRENLLAWLKTQNLQVPPATKIRILTFPRVLGYVFNPVTFYYLTKPDGSSLTAVAEVVNTFRETKFYLVDSLAADTFTSRPPKNFYVSPFSDPTDTFHFRLGLPAEKWTVKINNLHNGTPSLITSLNANRKKFTAPRLLSYTLRYPLLSLKIITGIHLQALKLWLKKIPYFPKGEQAEAKS